VLLDVMEVKRSNGGEAEGRIKGNVLCCVAGGDQRLFIGSESCDVRPELVFEGFEPFEWFTFPLQPKGGGWLVVSGRAPGPVQSGPPGPVRSGLASRPDPVRSGPPLRSGDRRVAIRTRMIWTNDVRGRVHQRKDVRPVLWLFGEGTVREERERTKKERKHMGRVKCTQ